MHTRKLVFLFIVREEIVQNRLWKEFFRDADPERYECFYYSINGDAQPNIHNLVRFPNTLHPQYGHFTYVQVVLMMLAYGLQDPRNYKFILLSESCIPLTSFQTVFNRVMRDDKTYLYHFQVGTGEKRKAANRTTTEYPDEEISRDPELSRMFWDFFGPTSIASTALRYGQIADRHGIDRRTFHKFLAQGICFQRAFVEFLIETKGDLDNYRNVEFIEEHYYLCPLNKRNIPFSTYILKKNLMGVTWHGCRPKQYTSAAPVTKELVDRMRGWEFCFMRKVDKSCPMDENLISYLLERSGAGEAVPAKRTRRRSPSVVMTYCSGYDRAVYERFIGTLFDVGFDGLLVMFIREEDLHTVRALANRDDDHLQFVTSSSTLGSKYARYQAYYDYLTSAPEAEACERVFIYDSRDVIFQKNVFDYPWDPSDDIGVFEENARIRECKWNSLWMKRFGEDIFEKLKDHTVLCAGTILGKKGPIIAYLKTMIEIIEDEIGFDTIRHLGPHADGDQGVFNYLFHTDRLPQCKVRRFKVDDPLAVTIHHAHPEVNDEGQIVDQNGSVFWCVHQFDRLPRALRLKHIKLSPKYNLATRYGTTMLQSDTIEVIPSPYVQIDNFLTPEERDRLLDFALQHEPELRPGKISTNVPDYRKSRVHDSFHDSDLAKLIVHRVRERLPDLLREFDVPSFSPKDVEIQLTANNNGDFSKIHNDNGFREGKARELTYVYYFYREPKPFVGGELVLYDGKIENNSYTKADTFKVIEPRNNSIAVFLSGCLHEVLPIRCPSQAFGDSRFTVNGWVQRQRMLPPTGLPDSIKEWAKNLN